MFRRINSLLGMIKFSHTLFALPFALLGAALAAKGPEGWRGRWQDVGTPARGEKAVSGRLCGSLAGVVRATFRSHVVRLFARSPTTTAVAIRRKNASA